MPWDFAVCSAAACFGRRFSPEVSFGAILWLQQYARSLLPSGVFFSVVQVKFSHHFAMIIQWNKNYHLMKEKTTQLDLRLERHKRKDACLLPQAILEANCISKNRQETN